jgi:hypothetical protein
MSEDDLMAHFAPHLESEDGCRTAVVLLIQKVASLERQVAEHEVALGPVKQGKSLFLFLLMLGTFSGSVLAIWDKIKVGLKQ